MCVILIPLFELSAKAQEFIWDAGVNGFFDNREYFNDYVEPQTMFGIRPFGTIGLRISDYYQISFGLDVLYEFGGAIDKDNLKPIIYFQFKKEPLNLIFGSSPRKDLINLPNVLQTDTFNYYRPNIEGIFLEFRKPWGFQNIWLDWTSRQTDVNRETFLIGGTGMLKKSIFYYKHDFIMTHFAGPSIPIPDDHLRDNGGLYAGVGIYHPRKSLDSLSFSIGYTMSYDRLRNVYDLYFRNGSLTELYFQYRGFGIKSALYLGEGQVQMVGDGLYAAKFYNRNDLFWKIFRKDCIEGKVEFSLHILKDLIDVSQSLTLYVKIGGGKKFKPGY